MGNPYNGFYYQLKSLLKPLHTLVRSLGKMGLHNCMALPFIRILYLNDHLLLKTVTVIAVVAIKIAVPKPWKTMFWLSIFHKVESRRTLFSQELWDVCVRIFRNIAFKKQNYWKSSMLKHLDTLKLLKNHLLCSNWTWFLLKNHWRFTH